MGSELIKPLETYNACLNISVSIILPLCSSQSSFNNCAAYLLCIGKDVIINSVAIEKEIKSVLPTTIEESLI